MALVAVSVEPKFRTLRQFDGDDALARRVSHLEDNIERAFMMTAKTAAPLGTATNRKTADYVAKIDELVTCAGTFTLGLPAASAENAGRSVTAIVESGTVTVRAVSGNVQGGSSDALATIGLRRYVSNGTDWWRAP